MGCIIDLSKKEHSYFIGFVQADGHHRRNGGRGCLSIELNIRDIDILNKFRTLFSISSTIHTRKRTTNFKEDAETATLTFFDKTFRDELIKNKVPHGVERFLTVREWDYLREFIETLPQDNAKNKFEYERTKWIFSLLYLTGCRRSEVINARMSDFVSKRSQWWLKVVGKGNKYGEIPVPNELLSALIRYRKSLGLAEYPNPLETELPLIYSKYGKLKPISDSMLYKIIKTTCNNLADQLKADDPASAFVIARVSTHWMRHTSATHQVDAGIDIRVVKENLRHSMLETTMKYQHTEADSRHDETIKKFGK
jgi:integrase